MTKGTEPAASRVADIQRILGRYVTRRSKLDLLVFWGRHPRGWFGRRAVSPLTRASREEINRSLGELVQEGVIDRRQHGAMHLYGLTGDPTIRRSVEELTRLTRSERDHLLHYAVDEHGVGDHEQGNCLASNMLQETIEGAGP